MDRNTLPTEMDVAEAGADEALQHENRRTDWGYYVPSPGIRYYGFGTGLFGSKSRQSPRWPPPAGGGEDE